MTSTSPPRPASAGVQVPRRRRPRPGLSPGWATATSLADLGELTARWLTGEYAETPTHAGPPDKETRHLIPLLSEANRGGVVTDFSQPGCRLASGLVQRAAVGGYCHKSVCARLADAVNDTNLTLLHEDPHSGPCLPVTIVNEVACTWVGGTPPLDIWDEQVPAAVLLELDASCYVTVVDTLWGCNDRLWPLLATVLGLDPDTAIRASATPEC